MVGVARGGGCRTRMAQAGSTTGQTREPLSKPPLQTARTATLEAFTLTRTHAHHTNRRGLLYLRQEAHGHRTDRPCVPLRPTLACAHPAQVAVKPLMSIPSKAGAKRSHASVAQSLVGSGPARLLLRLHSARLAGSGQRGTPWKRPPLWAP